MKNILVPVGNTNNGITNLKYAIHFASMSGAKVYLINVYKEFSKVGSLTKVNQLVIEDHQEQLDEVLSQVDTKGVEVVAKPVKGDPFEGISRVSKQLNIDMIVLSPQSVDIHDEVYLGGVTGKIVKQTDVPVLIVPRDYIFRKVEVMLLAFKRGVFSNEKVLNPLKEMVQLFSSKLNLLQVVTADVDESEMEIDAELLALSSSVTKTDNATIFQGLLEHFQSNSPDMICVLRRKRGFFQRLWEKNSVLKKEFHTSKPLLVLRGEE